MSPDGVTTQHTRKPSRFGFTPTTPIRVGQATGTSTIPKPARHKLTKSNNRNSDQKEPEKPRISQPVLQTSTVVRLAGERGVAGGRGPSRAGGTPRSKLPVPSGLFKSPVSTEPASQVSPVTPGSRLASPKVFYSRNSKSPRSGTITPGGSRRQKPVPSPAGPTSPISTPTPAIGVHSNTRKRSFQVSSDRLRWNKSIDRNVGTSATPRGGMQRSPISSRLPLESQVPSPLSPSSRKIQMDFRKVPILTIPTPRHQPASPPHAPRHQPASPPHAGVTSPLHGTQPSRYPEDIPAPFPTSSPSPASSTIPFPDFNGPSHVAPLAVGGSPSTGPITLPRVISKPLKKISRLPPWIPPEQLPKSPGPAPKKPLPLSPHELNKLNPPQSPRPAAEEWGSEHRLDGKPLPPLPQEEEKDDFSILGSSSRQVEDGRCSRLDHRNAPPEDEEEELYRRTTRQSEWMPPRASDLQKEGKTYMGRGTVPYLAKQALRRPKPKFHDSKNARDYLDLISKAALPHNSSPSNLPPSIRHDLPAFKLWNSRGRMSHKLQMGSSSEDNPPARVGPSLRSRFTGYACNDENKHARRPGLPKRTPTKPELATADLQDYILRQPPLSRQRSLVNDGQSEGGPELPRLADSPSTWLSNRQSIHPGSRGNASGAPAVSPLIKVHEASPRSSWESVSVTSPTRDNLEVRQHPELSKDSPTVPGFETAPFHISSNGDDAPPIPPKSPHRKSGENLGKTPGRRGRQVHSTTSSTDLMVLARAAHWPEGDASSHASFLHSPKRESNGYISPFESDSRSSLDSDSSLNRRLDSMIAEQQRHATLGQDSRHNPVIQEVQGPLSPLFVQWPPRSPDVGPGHSAEIVDPFDGNSFRGRVGPPPPQDRFSTTANRVMRAEESIAPSHPIQAKVLKDQMVPPTVTREVKDIPGTFVPRRDGSVPPHAPLRRRDGTHDLSSALVDSDAGDSRPLGGPARLFRDVRLQKLC
ncbi:hypothetical protein T439DRAFT_378287 [Meredithblackwellia eburnea MCA 4105]